MKKTYGHIQRERELDIQIRIELMKSGAPCDHRRSFAGDIATAWELDGAGWKWYFEESSTLRGELLRVWCRPDHRREPDMVGVIFADFNSKAAAYAYARCRCWLQAKQAEREAADDNA